MTEVERLATIIDHWNEIVKLWPETMREQMNEWDEFIPPVMRPIFARYGELTGRT